jgi:hypothetical protein
MKVFKTHRAHRLIPWIERERGWVATQEDIVNVLSPPGFEEGTREMTIRRRDRHPAGGAPALIPADRRLSSPGAEEEAVKSWLPAMRLSRSVPSARDPFLQATDSRSCGETT